MDQEREYNSYTNFSGLFDIEAISSSTEDSVTLYINGTNRSNNVTVTCRNVDVNIKLGEVSESILFSFILKFVGR